MEAKPTIERPHEDLVIGGLYMLVTTQQHSPNQPQRHPLMTRNSRLSHWEWELYLHTGARIGVVYFYHSASSTSGGRKNDERAARKKNELVHHHHRVLGFQVVSNVRTERHVVAMVQVHELPRVLFLREDDTITRLVEILYALCRLSRDILLCKRGQEQWQGKEGRMRSQEPEQRPRPSPALKSRTLFLRVLRRIREVAADVSQPAAHHRTIASHSVPALVADRAPGRGRCGRGRGRGRGACPRRRVGRLQRHERGPRRRRESRPVRRAGAPGRSSPRLSFYPVDLASLIFFAGQHRAVPSCAPSPIPTMGLRPAERSVMVMLMMVVVTVSGLWLLKRLVPRVPRAPVIKSG